MTKVLARYEKKTSPVPNPERVKLYLHLIEKAFKGKWARINVKIKLGSSGYALEDVWRWVRPSDSWAFPGDRASFAKAMKQLTRDCVLGEQRNVPRFGVFYVPDHERDEFTRQKIRLDRMDAASETITGLLARHGVESHYNSNTNSVHPTGLDNLEEMAALLKKHLG